MTISLIGHLNESESFFNYSISNSSYSTMNDGYQTYVPLFTEDVLSNTSDSILQACNNDPKCVYDYTATGNMEVGLSTLDTAVKNDDIVTQISEHRSIYSLCYYVMFHLMLTRMQRKLFSNFFFVVV